MQVSVYTARAVPCFDLLDLLPPAQVLSACMFLLPVHSTRTWEPFDLRRVGRRSSTRGPERGSHRHRRTDGGTEDARGGPQVARERRKPPRWPRGGVVAASEVIWGLSGRLSGGSGSPAISSSLVAEVGLVGCWGSSPAPDTGGTGPGSGRETDRKHAELGILHPGPLRWP